MFVLINFIFDSIFNLTYFVFIFYYCSETAQNTGCVRCYVAPTKIWKFQLTIEWIVVLLQLVAIHPTYSLSKRQYLLVLKFCGILFNRMKWLKFTLKVDQQHRALFIFFSKSKVYFELNATMKRYVQVLLIWCWAHSNRWQWFWKAGYQASQQPTI